MSTDELTNRSPIDRAWLAAQADTFETGPRIAEARAFWEQHGPDATHATFVVCMAVIREMVGEAPDGHRMATAPPNPPESLYGPLGGSGRGEVVAQATWSLIAATSWEQVLDLADPFLDDHGAAVCTMEADAVYLFAWWAWSAFEHIRSTRNLNGVEVARIAITVALPKR